MTTLIRFIDSVFTVIAVVGIIMGFAHLPGYPIVLLISLILPIVFFIRAFMPVDVPKEEDRPLEFSDTLALLVAPKVLWLGCSFTLFGIITLLLHAFVFKQLMMAGAAGILIATAITVPYYTAHRHHALVRPLYRAVPIALAGIYLVMSYHSGNPGFY